MFSILRYRVVKSQYLLPISLKFGTIKCIFDVQSVSNSIYVVSPKPAKIEECGFRKHVPGFFLIYRVIFKIYQF